MSFLPSQTAKAILINPPIAICVSSSGCPVASGRVKTTFQVPLLYTPLAFTSWCSCTLSVPKPLAFMSTPLASLFLQNQILTGPPSTCAIGWPWAKWAFLSPTMNSTAAESSASSVGSAYSRRMATLVPSCRARTLKSLTVASRIRFGQWTWGDIGNLAWGAVFQIAAVGSSAGRAPFTNGALTALLSEAASGDALAGAFSSATTDCTINNPRTSPTPAMAFGRIWVSPRFIRFVLSLLTSQRVGPSAFHDAYNRAPFSRGRSASKYEPLSDKDRSSALLFPRPR